MILPDLLITWHESADYPIARMLLKRHRDRFGKIIVYFSKHFREPIYSQFLKENLKDLGNIVFLDPIEYKYGVDDWRNVSTNYMLGYSDSEIVCSVEQDWFSSHWEQLYEDTMQALINSDVVGWYQPNGLYVHPAWWFMKRESLEGTTKDFAAHDGYDHFGWITKDAHDKGMIIKTIQELGWACDSLDPLTTTAFHLGGVNQNYLEGLRPEYVYHRPDIFYVYNHWCRKANVTQSPLFTDVSIKIEERLRGMFPDVDPETSPWAKFFV